MKIMNILFQEKYSSFGRQITVSLLLFCICGYVIAGEKSSSKYGYDEVWVTNKKMNRSKIQNGSIASPYRCSGKDGLDKIFKMLAGKYGNDLTVHLGPGVFYGTELLQVRSHWKIRGAGMDVTILRTTPNPENIKTVGFISRNNYPASNFELSDLTIDFNVQALKKSNRVFSHPEGKKLSLGYYYVSNEKLSKWNSEQQYSKEPALGKLKRPSIVMWKGKEYLAVPRKEFKGIEPGTSNKHWALLHPTAPGKLQKWQRGKKYTSGEAVSFNKKAYYCLKDNAAAPNNTNGCWSLIAGNRPHPRVYTFAAMVGSIPPKGGSRISRVKAINGHGNWFLRKEAFLFALGGDNNVIENCYVSDFHGDYSTLIVVRGGANNIVRNCTIIGNGGSHTMAYGGWGCFDTRFENNFATNCASGSNIDSLTNKNVTFFNNVFTNIHSDGIKFRLPGSHNNLARKTTIYHGKKIPRTKREIDGLYIINNFIEMNSKASKGGIYFVGGSVKTLDSIRNVLISGNILRTSSGKSDGKANYDLPTKSRAILIRYGRNIIIKNNYCENGSIIAIPPVGVKASNNFYFNGKPAEIFTVKIYGKY